MASTILLRGEPVALDTAAGLPKNYITAVKHQDAVDEFKLDLWECRASIDTLVRHHLRLSSQDSCEVLNHDSWLHGGFNMCVFVRTIDHKSRSAKFFVFRSPLTSRVSENHHPGRIDEKLGCELATHAYFQEYCADIRIPHLYAFGNAT
ncbi:hypothetical protein ANO11243_036370 [Dothideomycetidae sp. 11243]|nr:hypothetical protein ANO11243_036370 [fungal sp. No.11243]